MYVIDPLVNLLCMNLNCIKVRQHEDEDIAIQVLLLLYPKDIHNTAQGMVNRHILIRNKFIITYFTSNKNPNAN
jgi:hypothetical protein